MAFCYASAQVFSRYLKELDIKITNAFMGATAFMFLIILCKFAYMKNLLFFFYLIPFVSFSQIIISANIIERTDTKKKITNILDLSIGSFINNDLIVGITNEDAVADYIEHGFNPIQDSFIVSNLQLFFKYYDDKGYFFLMKIPTSSNVKGISIYDRIRVGGGYNFYADHNLDFHVSYDVLLNPNLIWVFSFNIKLFNKEYEL